jgi:histidinol-phosphate aminotransferase
MSAYKPPLEGRNKETYTLLDFNERTIPVGQAIVDALEKFIAGGRLQQYPAYGDIVSRLADYSGVKSEQLMITNGSDQGIDLVFRSVSKPDAEAIIPGPTFAMYHQCAKVEEMKIIEPLYSNERGYPVREVIEAVNPKTAIIVIANPNNPCGTGVEQNAIVEIAKAAPNAAVLVDECYYEYTKETILPLLNELPNVFVTRTFSKTWGIPSLRFGYLMAAKEFISALCNVRGPYDINQLAIVAAEAALENPEYTEQYVDEIMKVSKPLLEAWLTQKGISFWQSTANYIWAFPKNVEALNKELTEQGFLVRPKDFQNEKGLRITLGTEKQMRKLISVWEAFL